jgi:cellobiose transport system permease protein
VAPFLIAFSLFFVFPAAYSLYLSFTSYRGYGPIHWTGLNNYLTILSYGVFWETLKNSAFYWVAHAIPMMTLSLTLALIVRAQLVAWIGAFRIFVFLPYLLATVAAAMVFQNMFGEHYGIINSVFGLNVAWLRDPSVAPWTLVAVLIWRNTGYWFVVFLAALTSVPSEVEEAAMIDGANSLQRLHYIILPIIRPTILFAVLVDAIMSVRLYAEPNVLLGAYGSPAPVSVAPILNLVVTQIQGGHFGLAATAGWLLFLTTGIISVAISSILRPQK